VKTEGNIDPQLSQAIRATPFNRDASPFTPLDRVSPPLADPFLQDAIARHRARIPQMRGWQNPSTSPHTNPGPISTKATMPSQSPSDHHQDTETSSDYFHTFILSPTRTAYPDPSELAGFQPASSPIVKLSKDKTSDQPWDTERSELVQSPILKGIKWPGMSLFDSASVEAQRRRNQKKDASILEQMEHNSVSVEHVERIYWPNGELKHSRLITGNVESSPIREATPSSPPPKRQRAKANKVVLKDLSTNIPKRPRKPRARKTNVAVTVEQYSNSGESLASPSPSPIIYPRTADMGHDPPDDNDNEMQPTRGRPRKGRGRAFNVFHDEDDDRGESPPASFSKKGSHSSTRNGHGHEGLRHQSAANFTLSRKASGRLPWDAQLRAFASNSHHFAVDEDRENIEPLLDSEGRIDDGTETANNERVTQRYFSVTSNRAPQFYNSMPPQMEFCGIAGPKYHGSSLNPLNAYLQHQQYPTFHPQPPLPPLAQLSSTGNGSHGEKRGYLASSTFGRALGSARSRD